MNPARNTKRHGFKALEVRFVQESTPRPCWMQERCQKPVGGSSTRQMVNELSVPKSMLPAGGTDTR